MLETKNQTDGFPWVSDDCVYCGLCAKKCPVNAIAVDRSTKSWTVDKTICVQCGSCADACVKKAITIDKSAQAEKKVNFPKTKGVLVCDESLCTGCMNCMFACTLNKDSAACPDLARIQMNIHTQAEFNIAAQPCLQCVDPKCAAACPVGAIQADPETGARVVKEDLCIGCKSCISACPYEIPRIRFDKKKNKATKCDLCGGDPQCVKMCPTGALKYVTDPDGINTGYGAEKEEEKLYGYAGKILRIDLTTKEISTEPITKYAPKYIGGRGMGARIYWDEIKPDADAFSGDNKLIFLSGPLTGTGAQGGGRSSLITKAGKGYPKKTYWHGTSGNQFGTEMKYAGYDVLIVQGISEKPVYILINDDKVEIRDAAAQWGMLVEPARTEYKRLHGEKAQAAIIGPAGENLVVHSSINTEFSSGFSQGGVGAVMGSKKLKAIVVSGTGALNIAKPKAFMDVISEKIDWISTKVGETKIIDGKPYEGKKLKGCTMFGGKDWAYQNDGKGEINVKKRSCCGCPMSCRLSIEYTDKSLLTGSTECASNCFYTLQEMSYYGSQNLNGKVSHKMNELVENLGLDCMYPFNMNPWFTSRFGKSAFQRGIINQQNTGLLLDQYGSEAFGEDYLTGLAYRRGWGELVADGDEKAVEYVMEHEEFGEDRAAAKRLYEEWYPRKGDFNGVDFHSVFKYMDTPDYNLRLLTGQTDIKRAKDYEPSYHEIPSMDLIEKWMGSTKFMEPHYWGPEVAQAAIVHEAIAMEPDNLGLCCYLTGLYPYMQVAGTNFGQQVPSIENAPDNPSSGQEYWNAVMGTDLTQADLNRQYQMCRNVEAAILARESTPGKNRENYEYFDWVYEELKDSQGVQSMTKEEYERTLSEYFAMRGWDENGVPTRKTLTECGLEDIADELDRLGILSE